MPLVGPLTSPAAFLAESPKPRASPEALPDPEVPAESRDAAPDPETTAEGPAPEQPAPPRQPRSGPAGLATDAVVKGDGPAPCTQGAHGAAPSALQNPLSQSLGGTTTHRFYAVAQETQEEGAEEAEVPAEMQASGSGNTTAAGDVDVATSSSSGPGPGPGPGPRPGAGQYVSRRTGRSLSLPSKVLRSNAPALLPSSCRSVPALVLVLGGARRGVRPPPPSAASTVSQTKDARGLTGIQVAQHPLPNIPSPHFGPGLRSLTLGVYAGHGVAGLEVRRCSHEPRPQRRARAYARPPCPPSPSLAVPTPPGGSPALHQIVPLHVHLLLPMPVPVPVPVPVPNASWHSAQSHTILLWGFWTGARDRCACAGRASGPSPPSFGPQTRTSLFVAGHLRRFSHTHAGSALPCPPLARESRGAVKKMGPVRPGGAVSVPGPVPPGHPPPKGLVRGWARARSDQPHMPHRVAHVRDTSRAPAPRVVRRSGSGPAGAKRFLDNESRCGGCGSESDSEGSVNDDDLQFINDGKVSEDEGMHQRVLNAGRRKGARLGANKRKSEGDSAAPLPPFRVAVPPNSAQNLFEGALSRRRWFGCWSDRQGLSGPEAFWGP